MKARSKSSEGFKFNPDKLVIEKKENMMSRRQESMAEMMKDKGIIHKRAAIMHDDFESFKLPWVETRKNVPMYDFTTRLNTDHLNLMDPRELCRSYTADVYSPPHECV